MLLNDRYQIGPKLGHGGMGAVFRAYDKRLEREVAVKVMAASLQELGEKGRARFLREAHATAQLNHPNILNVYDVGEDQGEPFIVMELVEGQSLYDRPPRNLEEIVVITRQICAALEHAHSHGIVHRDLKPGNVLLTPKGQVKLTDFGLARLVSASHLTSGQTLIGTPLYMAPEQALGQELDGRADLYALGVMLYEWTTGRYPFNDKDSMAIVAQHIHAPVVPPRTHRPDVPPVLEAIILKLMAKNPAERFASAQEVIQAFTQPTASALVKPAPATPTHLPVSATSFIGREDELAKVTSQLADKNCRLLTILGPGGVGKTRLAIEAAAQVESKNFKDGIYFVALEALSAPEFIVPAVAAALHFPLQNPQTAKEQLLTYLRPKQLLLVLDNFEQILGAAAWVVETLRACPAVKIMATSRERLNLEEEWVLAVDGFLVPDAATPQGNFETNSAVQLFGQRARRANPGFSVTEADRPAVARICQVVGGIPLAIELAATWAKMMPCAEIAEQIERNLDFLNTSLRNIPERHRSLRAVFEVSWKLLTEEERRVFRQLSVFRGGFRREAAATVLSRKVQSPKSEVGKSEADPSAARTLEFELLETLSALMDKSLLRVTASGRYEQHPLTHQYAGEKLEAATGEKEVVEERHARSYADFLQKQVTRLKGRGADQAETLEEINEEIENVRAAWRWTTVTGETIGDFWEAYRYSILSGIGLK